jgi:predicted deacylase
MRRETIALPQVAAGTRRELTVLRFGEAGARPKAYLQAGLHADELPGMLVLRRLAELLADAEVTGEVVVVPVANPIGLAQQRFGVLLGRYESNSSGNFNRGYADLAAAAGDALAGRLGADAAANVAAIRGAMAAALAAMEPRGEIAVLRRALLGLAHDADLVLDLHADNQAVMHLYTGTPLWPGFRDLAAELGARAVLLAEVSGGDPFDEACSGPWWALARRFPEAAIPPACAAVTVELRSNNDVEAGLAEDDARAIMRFLVRRGVVAGRVEALPAPECEATPLDATQQVTAPAAGLVVYRARLGDRVDAGDVVATIVDPLGGEVEVAARTAGVLFARHDQPVAWPGKVIGKIAGREPLPERTGKLLAD